MRVARESFTVLPDPARGEITLLIGGLKLILDRAEAQALLAQLAGATSGPRAAVRGRTEDGRQADVEEAAEFGGEVRGAAFRPTAIDPPARASARFARPLRERVAVEGAPDGAAADRAVSLAPAAALPPSRATRRLRELVTPLANADDELPDGGELPDED